MNIMNQTTGQIRRRKSHNLMIFFLVELLFLVVLLFIVPRLKKTDDKALPKMAPTTIPKKTEIKKKTVFVPYWEIASQLESEESFDHGLLNPYDRLIYFGIESNINGIHDSRFRIQEWKQFIEGDAVARDWWMTVIMTNTDVNLEILKDKNSWEKIISESVDLAVENKFNGIVLDLEMSVLPFDNVMAEITDFAKEFSVKTHEKNLKFAMTIYGDVFYRQRPYDIKALNNFTDEFMVMAYDFHKSRGEPGPNFPLDRRSLGEGGSKIDYGYDFKTMTNDFLASIPSDHLTIIFGMYGYDWQVDEKKRPLTQAKALSLSEIKKKFFNDSESGCSWENCVISRDSVSKETEINYVNSQVVDNYGYIDYHIVWYEDEESVKLKQEYLLEKGIDSIGYWAYGYF